MKRDGWEGGHRVPFIARWPGRITKGQVSDQMTSTTDIFAARRVLGDHLCLWGDVSASLLSIARPEEVSHYCKRLIDEVAGIPVMEVTPQVVFGERVGAMPTLATYAPFDWKQADWCWPCWMHGV